MAGEGWRSGTQRIFYGNETTLYDAIMMGLCHYVVVQLLSCVWLFTTPWTASHQASLPFTTTWSLLKFMSTESVMLSNCLILCHSLSSHLQSVSASRSFPMSRLFASGGQSIGASASASVLPMNIQGWFPLGLTGLFFLLSKGLKSLLQHHNLKASVLWHLALFMVQLWHPYMTTGKTIALTIRTFVCKVMQRHLLALISDKRHQGQWDTGTPKKSLKTLYWLHPIC